MGDKGETSVNSCSTKNPEWETSVGDKWETSVNSCGPRHPEWETSVKDKCGRQVWETSVNCKLMRPKEPRVGDKCERQVEDKCKPHAAQGTQSEMTSVGDKGETSVNSCSPGCNPGWETRGKNPIQCKLMFAQRTQSGRQRGRQV